MNGPSIKDQEELVSWLAHRVGYCIAMGQSEHSDRYKRYLGIAADMKAANARLVEALQEIIRDYDEYCGAHNGAIDGGRALLAELGVKP